MGLGIVASSGYGAGGTAQILRTQVASAVLQMKLPQTRDGYLVGR